MIETTLLSLGCCANGLSCIASGAVTEFTSTLISFAAAAFGRACPSVTTFVASFWLLDLFLLLGASKMFDSVTLPVSSVPPSLLSHMTTMVEQSCEAGVERAFL
jgi:hypothetical protein